MTPEYFHHKFILNSTYGKLSQHLKIPPPKPDATDPDDFWTMYPPRESQSQEFYTFESAWCTPQTWVLVFYRVLKHGEKRILQFYSDHQKCWVNSLMENPMDIIPKLIPFTGEQQ